MVIQHILPSRPCCPDNVLKWPAEHLTELLSEKQYSIAKTIDQILEISSILEPKICVSGSSLIVRIQKPKLKG